MFRPVRVRIPKARLSSLTPYPLATESNRQANHDEYTTSSTPSSITHPQVHSIANPENVPSPSFPTRLMSTFNSKLPAWPLSKHPPSTKAEQASPDLRKRDALQSQNVTIGVVVGVFLAIFLVALFYFLHRYNASIRLKRKRRKRRRASRTGSKGSTSSTTTQGSGLPEPAGV